MPLLKHLRLLSLGFALGLGLACGGGGGGTSSGGGPAPEPPAPIIISFNLPTQTVAPGATVDVNAVFANGTAILNPGNVPIASGIPKPIKISSGLTYTLLVTNSAGVSVSAIARVSTTADPLTPTIDRSIFQRNCSCNPGKYYRSKRSSCYGDPSG